MNVQICGTNCASSGSRVGWLVVLKKVNRVIGTSTQYQRCESLHWVESGTSREGWLLELERAIDRARLNANIEYKYVQYVFRFELKQWKQSKRISRQAEKTIDRLSF